MRSDKNENNKVLGLKLIFAISLLMILLTSCSSFSQKDGNNPITAWDLKSVGYYENWDNDLYDVGYVLGIVDINSEVLSDNGTISANHSDLIIETVKKISNICDTKIIALSSHASKDDFQTAITSLIDDGIKVINVSLGSSMSFELNDHIRNEIENNGIVIICSSGNDTKGLMYPALSEGTLSVLACDIYGNVSKNLAGTRKKSFTAPGLHVKILNNYFSGSSIASVYVSVICTAYVALYPDLRKDEIIEKLSESCIQVSEYSYGIIQIDKLFY